MINNTKHFLLIINAVLVLILGGVYAYYTYILPHQYNEPETKHAKYKESLHKSDQPAEYVKCTDCGGFYCDNPGLPVKSERLTYEEVCNAQVTMDSTHVYSYGIILHDLDPKTFVMLNGWYYKDHDTVYRLRKAIAQADAKTFDVVDPEDPWNKYALDKNNVYSHGQILEGIDPATFELITGDIWKDKNGVYNRTPLNKLPEADPDTFEILTFRFARDKDSVYTLFPNPKILKNADAQSFTILTDQYTKDKNAVYFYGRLLPEVKSNEFEIISTNGCDKYYGKDSVHVYFEDTIIPEANPQTFQVTDACYSNDDSGHYIHNVPVKSDHKEQCNFDDPTFLDATILPLYPLPHNQIKETQPTLIGKIVTYDQLLIDADVRDEISPYSGDPEQYVHFIPSKMKNATFYLDGIQVSDVYGLAQYPSVACELKTIAECFSTYKSEFPPILFFYKPSENLTPGSHRFKIELGTQTYELSFIVDSNTIAQPDELVCPALDPDLQKFYGSYHQCNGSYYQTGDPLYVPIPSYKNDHVFYSLSLPQNQNQIGSYSAQNTIQITIQDKLFDLKLPSSTYFHSTQEFTNQSEPYISYGNGLYIPQDTLVFPNGAKAEVYEDWTAHYLDLIPMDTSGHIYSDKIKSHKAYNSSGCDG